MACILKTRRAQRNFEAIDQYKDGLIATLTYNDGLSAAYNIKTLKGITTADDYVSSIYEGKYSSYDDLIKNGSESERYFFIHSVQTVLEQIHRFAPDPKDIQSKLTQYEAVLKYMDYIGRLEKASTIQSALVHRILGQKGVDDVSLIADVFMPKQSKLEHYEPTRKVFMHIEGIRNYSDNMSKELVTLTQELVKTLHKSSWMHNSTLSLDEFSKILPFFDGGSMREKGIYDNPLSAKQSLDLFIKSSVDKSLSEEQIEGVYRAGLEFRRGFNKINYGVENVDNMTSEEIMKNAPSNTIIGYIRSLKEKLIEMKTEVTDQRIDSNLIDSESIDRAIESFNNFRVRKDYIPFGSSDDEVSNIMKRLIDMGDKELNFSAWFSERKEEGASMQDRGVMLTIMDNLLGTALLAQDTSLFIAVKNLEHTIERDKNDGWFSSNWSRQEIGVNVINYLNILKKMITTNEFQRKDVAKATLLMQSYSAIIPALMLAKAGTGPVNALQAYSSVLSRIGNDLKDLDDSRLSALRLIREEISPVLMSVGQAEDYKQYRPTKEEYSMAEKMNEKVPAVIDWVSELYGLGKKFKVIHKYFTMKGTEEWARSWGVNATLQKLKRECESKGINLDDTSEENMAKIREISKPIQEKVFYDINGALGNYNPTNKPFVFHVMQKDAKNYPLFVVGGLLRWVYTFRHAAFSSQENFAVSLVKAFTNPTESMLDNKNFAGIQGAVVTNGIKASKLMASGQLLVALYDFIYDTFASDKDKLISTPVSSGLNMTKEASVGLTDLYYLTAMLSGASIDEKTAEKIKTDNMRFFFGMLSQSRLGTYFDTSKEDEMSREISAKVNPGMDLAGIFHTKEIDGSSAGTLHAYRARLRKDFPWNVPVGSNLPVARIGEILYHYNTLSSTNENATDQFKKDLALEAVLYFTSTTTYVRKQKKRKSKPAYDNMYRDLEKELIGSGLETSEANNTQDYDRDYAFKLVGRLNEEQ